MSEKIKLHKKILIEGTLELISGLRIGASKDNVEIGGVDLPVIKRKDNLQPYIPGSSIKGKMRSLLDIAYGESDTMSNPESSIGKLFGAISKNKKLNTIPSRLIVRDANLNQRTIEQLKDSEFTDMPFTEIKAENSINRIEGTAKDPRFIERVPAGSFFDIQFVINIITVNDEDKNVKEQEHLKLFYESIKLLEDDYLGGSGSRGYGQVKFHLNPPIHKPIEEYLHA
ncbi:type III-A CRISPR-associated RAMP protein Csm3 [Parafilimonas sp.]|uniref:type III-A CRISPR-associated RAMP protein Csm3 n=1 Tax=Parafilimonas sp. TaxID=1969739 RepID=UPI0039E452BF